MENEVKTAGTENEMRPEFGGGWDPPGCPFLFLGDDDAAEYDLELIKKNAGKIKEFFSQFKKKH